MTGTGVNAQRESRTDSNAPRTILRTPRLRLRLLDAADAPFILELLNEPGWLRFIGDKHVRTTEEAVRYIERGPLAMFEQNGFCLYCVERASDGAPIGMCGLIKRQALDDVDLGFAFLERYGRQGYAHESVMAVMTYARSALGLARIVAIVAPDNERSVNLLRKAGFAWERKLRLATDNEELDCFVHPG